MSEPTTDAGVRPASEPTKVEDFRGVLKALVGKNVTVVNPESYESAPMGFQLKEGFYTGKIGKIGSDFILFHTIIAASKKEGGKVPVKQYIPIHRIKRISLMKDTFILHL